jgi:predicted kinase
MVNMSKAIITMGLPGSGKSYVTDKQYPSMMKADCDAFKQLHPDYNPEHPELVHDWSKRCLDYLLQTLIESGDSFIYDSTGTDIVYIEALISKLLKAGYDIELLHVSVSIDTAIRRNSERPRKVPEHIIHTKQSQLDKAFAYLSPMAHTVNVVVNE